MTKFITILKQEIKLFKKIKLLTVGTLAIIALIIAFSLYYSSLGVDTLLYMQQICNYSFYICAVFSIISFVFLSYDKKSDLDEVLNTININHKSYAIITLLILLIIINLIMFLMILFVVVSNNSIDQLFSIYIPSFFLNIFFPLCISLLMSILFSYLPDYNIGGIFLITFLLLISPLFYFYFGEGFIEKGLEAIFQPFHFLYQADNYSMDYMYGLKDEPYRWFIIIAYFFILTGTIVFKKVKGKLKIILLSLTVFLASGSIAYSLKPQSTLNVDKSKNELMTQVSGSNETLYKPYQEVNYQFGNFDFEVCLTDQLSVQGTMTLESQKKQKEFVFTLYSGYKIQKLESDSQSHYKRDGNFVTITFSQPIQKANLKISYEGYHPTFYSNKQAVALPGYFPWYPMSGQHQIAYVIQYKSNGGYGYNSSNKINKTKVSLNVKANYPIISNIAKVANSQYSGIVDSLTLFGGNIEDGDKTFVNVFPAYYGKTITKQQNLKDLSEFYTMTLNSFKLYGFDKSLIENKKIISQPKSLTYFSDKNTISIFDDYIIAKDGIVTEELIVESLLNDMSSRSEIAHFLNGNPLQDIKKTKEFFKSYYCFSDDIEIVNRLDKILQKMSDKEFVNEFYSYGFGQTKYLDDDEFLSAMEAKYD